jgi:hypothetical protein
MKTINEEYYGGYGNLQKNETEYQEHKQDIFECTESMAHAQTHAHVQTIPPHPLIYLITD